VEKTVRPAADSTFFDHRAKPLLELFDRDAFVFTLQVLAVTQNHPPGVESRGFKITHPEKVKGLANGLRSGADLGHVKLSQDGLGQRNTGTQKQRLVEAAHRPGAPDRSADGAQTYSRRFKFTPRSGPRDRA